MAKKVEEQKFGRPTVHELDLIIEPVITEKTMSLMQEQNKVTVKVAPKANDTRFVYQKNAVLFVNDKQYVDTNPVLTPPIINNKIFKLTQSQKIPIITPLKHSKMKFNDPIN